MKPRKSWQPEYRFGGNKGSWSYPAELGITSTYKAVIKAPKPKKGIRK